ncbi:peptidoglycan-binding protein [Bradyrhizobium sp. LjRoot220]|uniref:peptidoglycan-binding domain-containing protein n=1 Tax=Bradyrhizobium sp. LjRoot220 TaxID=3342284 RepID=UPI003F4FECF8
MPSHVRAVSISTFPALVEVFPQYRDYEFFVVEDEVVFLDRERRVVDVVPAGPRARFSGGGSSGGGAMALNLSETEIREVQRVLIDQGLLTGEADGVLGPRTREALITFQRQQGIQVSGSIDTRTVSALGLSNRIQSGQNVTGGQSTTGQSTSTPSTTTGQGQAGAQQPAQANPPQDQSATGEQPSAQNQPAQQNTTGQAAPQNQPQNQSTVGQSGNQPPANQNMQPGQTTGAAPSSSGQANPPAQNPDQSPNGTQNPDQNPNGK